MRYEFIAYSLHVQADRNHKKQSGQGQPGVQVTQTQRTSLTDNADGRRSETSPYGRRKP